MAVQATSKRAELFVPTLSPDDGHGPQAAVIERLQALEPGRFDAVTVHVWGDSVALSTAASQTAEGRAVRDRLAAFNAWADEAAVTLAPFFEERSATAATGETHTVVDLPPFALAEYRDGDLVHVAPHAEPDTVTTVADRLATVEASGHHPLRDADTPPVTSR